VAEFLITVGIVALEILGYLTLVKIFPVMPNPNKHYPEEVEEVVEEPWATWCPAGCLSENKRNLRRNTCPSELPSTRSRASRVT